MDKSMLRNLTTQMEWTGSLKSAIIRSAQEEIENVNSPLSGILMFYYLECIMVQYETVHFVFIVKHMIHQFTLRYSREMKIYEYKTCSRMFPVA